MSRDYRHYADDQLQHRKSSTGADLSAPERYLILNGEICILTPGFSFWAIKTSLNPNCVDEALTLVLSGSIQVIDWLLC